MGYLNTIGKALRMDSERAVKYLGSGAKNAQKLQAKGAARGFDHNQMIRMRQSQQAQRLLLGGGAVGGLAMASKRKPQPMNPQPTAKGSGRYV